MKINLRQFHKLATLLAIICNISYSYALPDDKNQPIDVVADTASMDNSTGTTILTGKVEIVQGSLTITADKLVVQRNQQGDIHRMTATGNPAHFSQQQLPGNPHTKAWGTKMVYSVANQTITITGNAKVQQLDDKFTGDTVVYYMDKAIVKAIGTKQRVRMVIQPKGQK